ncbi:LysM peptidoglycan-binding domain-containing protein [Puniceicoccaceae bacterium K14]|nr:LysM peptidoglycan-binding domain-containing protein [Puniceicoccaceae bacterium K14]
MRGFKTVLLFCVALAAISFEANAQSSNLAYTVANLREDVRLLDEQIRSLQLQLEEMQRENDRLRRQVSDYESQADDQLAKLATESQLNQSLGQAIKQLEGRDDRMKEEVIMEVTKMLEKFTSRMSAALPKRSTKPEEEVVFTDNFPGQGLNYVVMPGDTLSGIAAKFKSTTTWIRNANRIVSPRHLQVGQEIFVPVAQEQ